MRCPITLCVQASKALDSLKQVRRTPGRSRPAVAGSAQPPALLKSQQQAPARAKQQAEVVEAARASVEKFKRQLARSQGCMPSHAFDQSRLEQAEPFGECSGVCDITLTKRQPVEVCDLFDFDNCGSAKL